MKRLKSRLSETLQLENVQMKLVLMQRNKRKVGGYELVLLVQSPFCERDFFVLINKKICDCHVAQTLLIGFYSPSGILDWKLSAAPRRNQLDRCEL